MIRSGNSSGNDKFKEWKTFLVNFSGDAHKTSSLKGGGVIQRSNFIGRSGVRD